MPPQNPAPPTLSVVLCTWNAVAYLEDCLDSLQAQQDPPDEVLVVDGGSRDGSRERVELFAARVSFPVRWLDQGPEPGLAVARNVGIREATGRVISFIDVDARARPDWVGRVRRAFQEDPGLTGLGGQGVEVGSSPADRFRAAYFTQGWGPRPLDQAPFLFGLCSHYRREALLEAGLYDPGFRSSGEDVEMGLKLRARGHRLRYDPEVVVFHARRDDWASLEKMVDRWAYYGHLAQLRHGRGRRPAAFYWARLAWLVARWLVRDAFRTARTLEGWWRRPLYDLVETRAVLRASRDAAGSR